MKSRMNRMHKTRKTYKARKNYTNKKTNIKKRTKLTRKRGGGYGGNPFCNNPNFSIFNTNLLKLFPYRP